MADEEWPVRVFTIEPRGTDKASKYMRVEFDIDRGHFMPPLRLSVLVPAEVDDASLVPLARNYLARTLEKLAEQTASWKLSQDAVQEILPE